MMMKQQSAQQTTSSKGTPVTPTLSKRKSFVMYAVNISSCLILQGASGIAMKNYLSTNASMFSIVINVFKLTELGQGKIQKKTKRQSMRINFKLQRPIVVT